MDNDKFMQMDDEWQWVDDEWQWVDDYMNGISVGELLQEWQLIDTEPGRVEPTYPEAGRGSIVKKRGKPWTEDEHWLFLTGLEKYGKGDWKSISRHVVSRTPTQVASHAQKYFLRHSGNKKERTRSSIFDITMPPRTNLLGFQDSGFPRS